MSHHRKGMVFAGGMLALMFASLSACSSSSGGAQLPTSGTFQGTLVDPTSGTPIAGAYVGIEIGGSYRDYSDRTKGSPWWQIGAITDAAGHFSAVVPGGDIGVHTFANGHYYGTTKFTIDSATVSGTIQSAPLAATVGKPTLAGAKLEPTVVGPGGTVVVTVTATKSDAKDPLSDEVLLIEPTTAFCVMLDPPSASTAGVGSPDGTFTKQFVAPTKPGTYTYGLSATSEACVTGDVVTLTLNVQ